MSVAKSVKRSFTDSGGSKFAKRTCILQPMTSDYNSINLNSGRNIVGRTSETDIRDVHCSKRQLELDVDMENTKAKLRVIGVNPCSVNGVMIMQDSECNLEHGSIIELVYGKHQFELLFKPSPTRKAKITNEEQNQQNPIDEEKSSENSMRKNGTGKWESVGNGAMMVYTDDAIQASCKIAGYDIDGTIITTKSGNVFPKHTDDWQILYPEVPKKLKSLQQSGYKICFFTNQGGIGSGKIKLDDFKRKIKDILTKLGVPVQVFIAIEEGHYRKPLIGMWQYLVDNKNEGVDIDLSKSFYVGDAAGRPESGSGKNKRRKDHSLADRRFAANIDLSFYTPEEHFLGKPTEQWLKSDYKPSDIVNNKDIPLMEPKNVDIPADNCEMIIMVGLPGSGKSYFCQEYLEQHNYTIANADTVGGTQACLKICEKALGAGTSCVVDNTNVDVESRKKFITLAKKYNVPCRCFVMNVPVDQVRHNIKYRHLTDSSHSKINEMVFNMMKKKYKNPTEDEGFTHIVKVNLKPKFKSTTEEQLYKLYLLEK
uniref:Bifunctional polynucleotide phosphatase/kinase n=1 Tax=Bactrocera dorsalis TaxID=27457 RepID=A0A034W8B2_BACDO